MARVALLGCGLGNVPFVRALDDGGHEVTLFSWPGNVRDCDRLRSLRFSRVALRSPLNLAWDFEHPERDLDTNPMTELSRRCRDREIEHLFGFGEAAVFALGLNRHLFQPYGIKLHVPATENLRAVQVRHELAGLCAARGIPSPPVTGVLGEEGAPSAYPVVAKLPTSAGSAGVRLVRSPEELAALRRLWAGSGAPVRLYRYVPGTREPSLTVLFDDAGNAAIVTWLRKLRYAGASLSTCVETTAAPPEGPQLLDFLAGLGLRGICSVQLKRDGESGELNVIEVNTRPGQNSRILLALWDRLGLDWPGHLLGAPSPAEPFVTPAGLVGISPVEDAAAVLKHLLRRRGRDYRRRDVLRSVWYSASRRPVIDSVTRVLVRDLGAGARIGARQFRSAYREGFELIPYGDLVHGPVVPRPHGGPAGVRTVRPDPWEVSRSER